MDAWNFFQLNLSATQSLHQVILSEAKPIRALPEITKQPISNTPNSTLFLSLISIIVIRLIRSFIVLFIWFHIRKVVRNKELKITIKYHEQFSCKHCRFFIDDVYLKCAVHPTNALTKRAINCSDYWH